MGAELICCHRLDVQALIEVDEYLYLNRTFMHDELWCVSEIEPMGETPLPEDSLRKSSPATLLMVARKSGSEQNSAFRLFDELIRARVGFHKPRKLLRSGLVSLADYHRILNEFASEINRNRKADDQTGSEIIEVAQELGLHPEPPLLNQKIWSAQCPGTNHKLFINAEKGEFGCGYCGVKGDSSVLRVLMMQRSKMTPAAS